jgi:hypothetical protein
MNTWTAFDKLRKNLQLSEKPFESPVWNIQIFHFSGRLDAMLRNGANALLRKDLTHEYYLYRLHLYE